MLRILRRSMENNTICVLRTFQIEIGVLGAIGSLWSPSLRELHIKGVDWWCAEEVDPSIGSRGGWRGGGGGQRLVQPSGFAVAPPPPKPSVSHMLSLSKNKGYTPNHTSLTNTAITTMRHGPKGRISPDETSPRNIDTNSI
jgi:hypothetical protein